MAQANPAIYIAFSFPGRTFPFVREGFFIFFNSIFCFMYTSYKDKLSDPRWQKRKAEILLRDNYTCQAAGCGCTTRTLHVHHLDYLGNIDPWDYPDDMLITLCDIHHDKEMGREVLEKNLANTLRIRGFLYDDLVAFSSAIDTNPLFCKYILTHIRKFKNG